MNRKILLLLLIINIACSSKNNIGKGGTGIKSDDSFYTIDFPEMLKRKQKVPVSEFAENVEYVILETTPVSTLGRIMDAKFTKDYIFVEHNGGPLAQFGKAGNFIRYIGKIGKGSEEYNGMREFSIDEEHNLIYIQSNWARNILVFSFDGSFIRSIKINLDEKDIVWSRDSLFMCFSEPLVGNEEYVFKEINDRREILQVVKNYCMWKDPAPFGRSISFPDRNIFYRLNNQLHFKGEYNDTIYTFNSNNKIVPKFFIDLKKFLLPPEMRIERGLIKTIPADYYWVSVKETSKYNFIHYATYATNADESWYSDEGYVCFDKQTKAWRTINNKDDKSGFINDLDGGPEFIPEYTNDSTAFCFVRSTDFKDYINSDIFNKSTPKYPEKKEILIKQMGNLLESNNDIIIVLRLKK